MPNEAPDPQRFDLKAVLATTALASLGLGFFVTTMRRDPFTESMSGNHPAEVVAFWLAATVPWLVAMALTSVYILRRTAADDLPLPILLILCSVGSTTALLLGTSFAEVLVSIE